MPDLSDQNQKLVDKILGWFIYASEHPDEKKFRKEAEEDFKFARGEQWDPDVRRKLEKKNHPVITINRIKKQVSALVGSHLQNIKDIKPIPVDSSIHDLGISKLMQALVKHSMYQGSIQWHFDKAQKEATIGGRGYLVPEISYRNDVMNGEPIAEKVSWRDIYVDPDSEIYDKSDATFFFRFAWMADWELKEKFPEKAEEIKTGFSTVFSGSEGDVLLSEGDKPDAYASPQLQQIFVDKKNKRVRVLACWYRTEARQPFMIDLAEDKAEPFEGGQELFDKFKEAIVADDPDRSEALKLENRTVTKIKFAVIAGGINLILEEGDTPYDKPPLDQMLPIIPFVHEEIDGMEEGIVRQLKDPQRETNKRRSKHMHLLNNLPPGLWIADEGATEKPGDLQKAMDNPNQIVWRRKGKIIERVEPTNPGEIFLHVDRVIEQDFFDIGVNPDLLGQEGSGAESGRAIMLRLSQGQLQIAEPLTNLNWSYRLLGIWLMGLIQMTYNEEKVLQVMGPEGAEVLLEINQPPDQEGKQNFITDLRNGNERESFKDFRNIKFDVVITTSPFAPTARAAQFAMMVELAQSGYPIPAQAIIEASDLPNKHELLRQMGTLTPSGPDQPSNVVQAQSAAAGRATPQ